MWSRSTLSQTGLTRSAALTTFNTKHLVEQETGGGAAGPDTRTLVAVLPVPRVGNIWLHWDGSWTVILQRPVRFAAGRGTTNAGSSLSTPEAIF